MSEPGEARYPDIEIYLRDTSPGKVLAWLKQRFRSITPDAATPGEGSIQHVLLESDTATIPTTIVPRIPGRFTGVTFDSPDSPWATDRECAEEAFDHFGVEVRCCAGSWQAGQEPDEWLRIDSSGATLITWRTGHEPG